MESLILVHGYLGGSAQWAAQVSAFSERCRVLTPDLPGFGNNAALQSPCTINGYAEYVLEYAASQGADEYALLGHSMGGMIVQEMVSAAPQRIKKLILYGTGALGRLPGRFETIEESARRIRADGVAATAKRISATWFMHPEQTAAACSNCAAIAVNASEQAALAGLEAMQNWSGEQNLPNISCPALVIWGDGDRAYPWSQPAKLWQNIPGARLAVVPGCSHAVHLEKPDIFNALVLDFLG